MYDKLTNEQMGIVVGELQKLQAWYCLIQGYGWIEANEMVDKQKDRIAAEVYAGTFKSQFGPQYRNP